MKFELTSQYRAAGDQPQAIDKLTSGLKRGFKHQTLLGVPASGKTFTIANIIENVQKPTLVISHNKTLAAQLYQEFREFFPKNAVCYFVSYYDYSQPEAYIPATDTYIEKETDINEEIDKLRLYATTALATRNDVVVIASVSAIYNLGSPTEYQNARLILKMGQNWQRKELLISLSKLQYDRNDIDFKRGTYRVLGEVVEIFPAYENNALRLTFLEDVINDLKIIHPISAKVIESKEEFTLYPAKHYIVQEKTTDNALKTIKAELADRLNYLRKHKLFLEVHRLSQRTNYDIEMIKTIGYCKGIENYSRHFDGRNPNDPPFSLLDHFSKDYFMVIDESHMTIPQIHGMYEGDRARKEMLVDFGFRLPSAFDNRPLRFEEFSRKINQVIYTSATPADYEMNISS